MIRESRFIASVAALQGMLANGYYTNISPEIIVQKSVEYADKLLNELSKPKDENNQ